MLSSARLQAYLREKEGRDDAVALAPFTMFFHPTDPDPEASYAVPDEPAGGDLERPLAGLRAAFAMRGRVPHVRFLDAFAPALAPALEAAGFVEVARLPVMACTPATARLPLEIAGLSIVQISGESPLDEVREGLDANALGFDPRAARATDAEAEAFRRTLVTSRAFTARLNGQPAGAGMFTEISDGVTELVGITTLAPFRRRGIAAYLTAHMSRLAFSRGAEIVFLIAAGAEAVRVYERAGFRLYTSLRAFRDDRPAA